MRSAVIIGPGRVELADVPRPDPGPGQVLLALEGCGLCGSELAVWEGRPWFEYPRAPGTPGHEGWGRVVALGAGVAQVPEGIRVAALSFSAHAEFDVADADSLVPLPDALDDLAVPGEALGCVANIARRCDFAPEQTVAVVGIGFIGALLVQMAVRAGARVIAISRRSFAREIARRMGAHETLALTDDALARVQAMTQDRGCDRVVEATGRQGPLDLCGQLTAVRGRLIIAGYHQDGPRQVDLQLWNWRGLDVVNAHERDTDIYVDGMRQAVELSVRGELTPSPLYTHEFPLERLDEAFALTQERPHGFLKALVTG